MVDESIWVVISALAGDHGVQLVHHGQQQLQLVSRLLQVDEHKLPQHCLPDLHVYSRSAPHGHEAAEWGGIACLHHCSSCFE